MDIYQIKGGIPLKGEVQISGAKNAALPIIVGSLLAKGKTTLTNIPDLQDIRTILKVIECLGAKTNFNPTKNILQIEIDSIKNNQVPYDLVKTMRASIYVMGPLLAKVGEADVSLPGGCAIGERPIDMHLKGFEKMGAEINLEHGYVKARVKKLTGARITMKKISVGTTANLMFAAVLARGKTVLENCALEPDIVDLGNFLIKMGAKISGLGTETIEIIGVKELKPVTYRIIPDRIEAGTFLLAGAVTKGNIKITKTIPKDLEALINVLKEIGFKIKKGKNWVSLKASENVKGVVIKTEPFPGFPTDLQAPTMSLLMTLPKVSVIIETIFENRYTHVAELKRMGADILIEDKVAIIKGGAKLSSAPVMMPDLRAGAALIIAALGIKGKTEIRRIYHSDRGYEKLPLKLKKLGAKIERIPEKN